MFFAKGEINMNNIYKVIWSKAKNCYVVASEIARSHTKSASGSEKIGGVARRKLLASLMALSLLCGGLGVAEASVHVNENTGGAYEVLTKQEVTDELNKKVSTEVADLKYAKASDVTTNTHNISTLDGKVTAHETAINELKTEDTALDAKIEAEKQERSVSDQALDQKIEAEKQERSASDQALNARITTAINGLKAKDTELEGKIQDNADAIDATNKRTAGIKRDDVRNETTIENNVTVDNLGNVTAKGQLTGKGVDAGTGDITTDGAVNAGSLKVENASNLKGDVTMDKKLSVTGDTSLNNADVGGALNVTGKSDLKDNVILGTNAANTVTVNGTANFNAAVNMDKGLTVDKGLNVNSGDTNLKNTNVEGNLKVTGTITTDKMIFGEKTTNNYTEIDHGKVTSKNQVVTGTGEIISSSSTFNAKKNEVGFANSATGEQSSHKQTSDVIKDTVKNNITGDQSFHKQTSDVIMDNVKDGENSNNRTQTKTETKDIITDKDGNSSTTSQTASENKTYLKDKDGKNTNSTIDTAKGYDKTIKGENGETSTKQDELNITNTAQNGTITNDAQNIVNNASNSITDKVGTNTRVTTSTSITDTVGTANRKIENDKITDTAGDSTVTTENGKGTTFAKTGSTAFSTEAGAPTDTNIAGNQITTGRVDANELGVSDKDGANTADLSVKAGEGVKASAGNGTTTGSLDVTAEEVGSSVTDASGKGSTFKQRIDAIMGNVKTDAGESEVTQKGDEITSVVGKGEATNSRVTQKKGSLEAAVTDGTNTNVSYDVANASAKVLTDGTKENKLQDNLDSSEKTITNGTYKTSKVQTALDITNTAKDGTITNDAKNIVNNASGDMTNTVGGKLTNTVEGGQENIISGGQINNITGDQTTNVTGDISNTAENITNEAKTSLTDKVGTNTRVIDSRSITDTVGTKTNRKIEDGKITDTAGDFTVTTDEDNGTTFANAGSTASSFTTVDGRNTVPARRSTNVKGNEISTGKVEANYAKMDYADVMNDLGVHGSAKVDNDLTVGGITTTKTLKVKENAEVGGTLDVTKKATFHDDVDIKKNLSVDGNATIKGDVTAKSYKVGDKTYIDANGINANNQKITNVADGSISEGSKDAVNGGQLYGVKRDLEHQVDKVGANAAAMANLRPMEFDPSSKWNIAAAIGNYGSETAAALGAFYRPNDNVMVNLSTAFGTGENMVGGGVSVRLGKGGNKLSREETNALKAQVADLTARMDALLSVLNPNMSKDFPDVPENHWAYEAVSRLAGNDIVQGYPDGEFHGERTMTRYEMAEIIYNALSRGAEAERELVEEFKPELQAMAASEKATAEKAEG